VNVCLALRQIFLFSTPGFEPVTGQFSAPTVFAAAQPSELRRPGLTKVVFRGGEEVHLQARGSVGAAGVSPR